MAIMSYKRIMKSVREDQITFGLVMNMKDPTIAEMAGLAGYDFIRVDGEHNVFSTNDVCSIVRAADSVGLPVFLRWCGLSELTALVDFGVSGFMIPHVKNKEHAQHLVELLKYTPVGRRGYTTMGRCQRYGYTPIQAYHDGAAADVVLMTQIEDESGLEHMEEIIATPGVDMICSGRGDIAQALGLFGQTNHPDVKEQEDRIIALAAKYGKTCQLTATDEECAKYYISQGVRAVTLDSDAALLIRAMKMSLETMWLIRDAFKA